MSDPGGCRRQAPDTDDGCVKPRKRSFKLMKKKKLAKKTSRISIGGECDHLVAAAASWDGGSKEPAFKERKTRGSSKRERWLLTRKTWRYMADAGRKLIPDGVQGCQRADDVPKIEAYFQEVCQKEPRFLLWRKQSYPGALGFRNRGRARRSKLGSVRENASSADEADIGGGGGGDDAIVNGGKAPAASLLQAHPRPAGRYELERLRKDFLFGGPNDERGSVSAAATSVYADTDIVTTATASASDSRSDLVQFINDYYAGETAAAPVEGPPLDHEELLEKLEDYIAQTKDARSAEDTAQTASGAAATAATTTTVTTSSTTTTEAAATTMAAHKKSSRTNILESDNSQKNLLETLRRYYARSTNREKVIGDMLIDRKLLENLYFELRKTRGFLGRRVAVGSSAATAGSSASKSAAAASVASSSSNLNLINSASSWNDGTRKYDRLNDYYAGGGGGGVNNKNKNQLFLPCGDKTTYRHRLPPPPLIEIEDVESCRYVDAAVQTAPVEPAVLGLIDDENRRRLLDAEVTATAAAAASDGSKAKGLQRRTSTDNDDISPSVSDTIKRYLRMARKKSVESDKADRFKRVNYDRNIRNIRGKGEPDICEGDDTNRSVQTDDSWLPVLKTVDENSGSRITSSRSSIDTGTTFSGEEPLLSPPLSPPKSLNAPGMQKSRSSTNVQQGFMSKRIWKGRSKSQTRTNVAVTSPWTPLGNCLWLHASGKSVMLKDLSLLDLTDLEKDVLSIVSLNKLQEISLGAPVRIPTGNVLSAGPKKRRPYLLKRRANTTGNLKDKDENESLYPHTIFGVSLNDCIEQEVASRSHLKVPTEVQYVPKSPRARSSFSSYIEIPKDLNERSHSCDSAASTPVSELIKTFTSSNSDILTDDNDSETKSVKNGVPNFVTSCLSYLEKYGLHKVGVFRISSSKKRLRQLREDFDNGKTLEETLSDTEDHVHDVATLLKEYFRALPDALLCNDLYQCFIQTQKIRNRHLQLDALKHLIQLLPIVNRNTLHALLRFLSVLAKFAEDTRDAHGHLIQGNKMDASNLATLFAPNILHKSIKELSSNDLSDEMTIERRYAIDVITQLIVNHEYLFKVPAELLDEVYVYLLDTNPSGLDNVMRIRFSNVEKNFQTNQESSRETNLLNVPSGAPSPTEPPDPPAKQPVDGPEKKIWTRGEFTHQNSGIGVPDDHDEYKYKNSRPRERETRRSRSKGITFFPDDVEAFTYPVFERMHMNTKSERFPTNQIHANGNQVNEGIVTASLMIPVPVKQQPNTPYPLNVEDTDIPYIEDENGRQTHGLATTGSYHRMLAAVSSDSSSAVSTPPTSPDHASGTSTGGHAPAPDHYRRKTATGKPDAHRSSQSGTRDPFRDAEPDHHYGGKADKKAKEKDVKFYQKILSSTGLDRLSKSASSTGLPKTAVYKEKPLKHGHDEPTLPPEAEHRSAAQYAVDSGAVLRSRTADIEHMLRKQAAVKPRKISQSSELSAAAAAAGGREKPRRKTSSDGAAGRHPLRIDPDPHVGERLAGGPSYRSPSPTRNVWRRKDVISSMPEHRRPYN